MSAQSDRDAIRREKSFLEEALVEKADYVADCEIRLAQATASLKSARGELDKLRQRARQLGMRVVV